MIDNCVLKPPVLTPSPRTRATKTRHVGALKLQMYDPRLGRTKEVIDKDGKITVKDKFPMKWGHGMFHFGSTSENTEVFLYETRKKMLVHMGTKRATILWREFLKETGRYDGATLRALRAKKGVGMIKNTCQPLVI